MLRWRVTTQTTLTSAVINQDLVAWSRGFCDLDSIVLVLELLGPVPRGSKNSWAVMVPSIVLGERKSRAISKWTTNRVQETTLTEDEGVFTLQSPKAGKHEFGLCLQTTPSHP